MKYLLLIIITACSMLFISCEAPPGPMGPQGPQGEQGIAGEDGTDGAANIQTYRASWETSDIFWDMTGYGEVAFSLEALTSTIVNEGVVLAYYGDEGSWVALPWTFRSDFNGDGTTDTMEFSYAYEEGTFYVIFFYDGGDVPQDYFPTGTVKIVLIPPSETAAKMKGRESIPYSEIEHLLEQ